MDQLTRGIIRTAYSLFVFGILLPLLPTAVQAHIYTGDPPPQCVLCACQQAPCSATVGQSALSLTEGNVTEQSHVAQVKSTADPTLDLALTYNSYDADNLSRTRINTVLGAGWTHSYNMFLFSQGAYIVRMDGNGRLTRYRGSHQGPYTTDTGYFETLVRNANGSFALRRKDGTIFTFAPAPRPSFLFPGPVWHLIRIEDRNHNITSLSYSGGNLTLITDTYGRSLALHYNSQGKVDAITDPLGRTTSLTYDSTGNTLTSIEDPEGKRTQYQYNALYQLTQKIDKDGRTFFYSYAQGKPNAISDGVGATLFSLTNPNGWALEQRAAVEDLRRRYLPSTVRKIDGRGNIWQYDYERHGYVTRVVAPDGATTTYTYDDPKTLRVASMMDANGHTSTYVYDALGNVTKKTDVLGRVTTYTYEAVFSQMTSMTDANGRVTSYTIDPATGDRLRETDPLGQTRIWTYDSHGNVLMDEDKRGNVTSYVYDAFGNRTQTIDREGHVWTMTYDAVGNVLTRTDPLGHTTRYTYDRLNRPIQETTPVGDPLQADTRYVYDGEGDRTRVIDRNGNATRYQYDLRQRLITETDAQSKSILYAYDGNNNHTSITDKNGHTTTLQYDVQNRLIITIDAENDTSSGTYDDVGNQLSETDANGHTTRYAYDALNRITTRTDAEGFVTHRVYDMVGTGLCAACTGPTMGSSLITQQVDGNGKVTYFLYDTLDRLVTRIRKQGDTVFAIDADDAVTRYTYDVNNNRLSLIEPNGNTMSYAYDKLDRQTMLINAAGDKTLTSYDPDGNVKTVTAPNLNVTANTYDALDRLIQVDDAVGRVATYTYDSVGNRLTQRDGNGNGADNAYDVINRLTDMTDALGKTTHYDYDAVGNLLQTTDREGHLVAYVYDKINRRSTMADALGNITAYTYDGVGNLTRIQITDAIDAKVEPTEYVYDKINRLIQETYPDGKSRFFAYDAVNLITRTDLQGQVTHYSYNDLYFLLQRSYESLLRSPSDNMTYDLSGRLLTAERSGWLVTLTYDGANRVLETTQNGETVSYMYDIPGRTRTLTYPGGRTITENTDARSRLATIDDEVSPPPIVTYSYDLGNRVISRTYRNGATASYTYNTNNWLLTLDHTIGATRIAGFDYDFDKEGNKRFEQKRHDPDDSEAYQYDNIYRLIDFKVGSIVGSTVPVPTTQTQYDLDGIGNWKTKTKDGVSENRTHSVTNEITQIDAVAVLSDPNGNTSEDGQYRYDYDEENRLTAVTRKSDGRVVGQYQYDALSRRIIKIADPALVSSVVETHYFYDGARIVEEQNAGGATQATYVYGNYIDEILTMDRSGTFYYHQNSLWSVEAITNSTASVVERYSYDAYGLPAVLNGAGEPLSPNFWGTPHSALENPLMFTGRQFDEETGLYYYRARYYDSVKGRFLQRDPLPKYFSGMDLYLYVGNNPTNFLDPFGLVPFTWEMKIQNWGYVWNDDMGAAVLSIDAWCSMKGNCAKLEPKDIKGLDQTNFPLKAGFDIITRQIPCTNCHEGFEVSATIKVLLPDTTTKSGGKVTIGVNGEDCRKVNAKVPVEGIELGAEAGKTRGFNLGFEYWWEQTIVVTGKSYDSDVKIKCCAECCDKYICKETSFTGWTGYRYVSSKYEDIFVKSHGFRR